MNNTQPGSPAMTESKPLTQIEFILCGLMFQNVIREIDITAYDHHNNQFVLSFPETNRTQAAQTIKRVQKLFGRRVADQLSFGIAEFPENGVMIEDLVAHAMQSCNPKLM